jgi:hypothetical protein
MIREKAITGDYFTTRELLNYIEANSRADLTYDSIRCFLEHRADLVKATIVAPGELARLQVPCQHPN